MGDHRSAIAWLAAVILLVGVSATGLFLLHEPTPPSRDRDTPAGESPSSGPDHDSGPGVRAAIAPTPSPPEVELGRRARPYPLPDAGPYRAKLVGTLVSAAGDPVAGRILVRMPTRDGTVSEMTIEAAGGRFGPLPLPAVEAFSLSASSPSSGRVDLGPLLLLPGETYRLDELRLDPPCTLQGTVTLDDGRPAVAAELTLRRSRGRVNGTEEGRPILARTATNTRGLFTFFDLAPEGYDLLVDHPAAARVEFLGLPASPVAEPFSRPLPLQPAAEIAGAVLDPRGAPLQGAVVTGRHLAENRLCERTTRTAQDGSFRLDRLEEGYYALEARAPGYLAATKRRVATGVRTLRFRMPEAGSLTGVVIDGPTDRPCERFCITLLRARPAADPLAPSRRGRRFLFEQAAGGFAIEGLAPGPYWLLAQTPRGRSDRVGPVRVSAGKGTPAGRLAVRPGLRLTGRVVGADGRGLTAWVVSVAERQRRIDRLVRPPEDLPGIETVTAADGQIDLRGTFPDRLRLLVRAAGHAPLLSAPLGIDPATGSIDAGLLRLERAATLEGVIKSASSTATGNLIVELVTADSSRAWSTTPDSAGHWRLIDLAPGPYELRVHTESERASDPNASPLGLDLSPGTQRRFTLAAGETRRLEIDLRGR